MIEFDTASDADKLVLRNYLTCQLENNKINRILFKNMPPSLLEELLTDIGATINNDCDFNGWQCDYWYTFIFNNKQYNISGSAWYGSVEISIDK